MKYLIAISSWENAASMGHHDALRNTWLKDLRNYPTVDYKFFVGDGNPTGEDEGALWSSFEAVRQGHKDIPCHLNLIKPNHVFVPKEDEVILPNCPDDYMHVTFKDKGIIRYAIAKDYDYLGICDTDTYLEVDRMMCSGFDLYDYVGFPFGIFAAEGSLFWLSKRVLPLIPDETVFDWGADCWIGNVLLRKGIKLHPDYRYREWPIIPKHSNDVISSHLGVPSGYYNTNRMYEVYENNRKTPTNRVQFKTYENPCNHPAEDSGKEVGREVLSSEHVRVLHISVPETLPPSTPSFPQIPYRPLRPRH